jgi:hypothetical protein
MSLHERIDKKISEAENTVKKEKQLKVTIEQIEYSQLYELLNKIRFGGFLENVKDNLWGTGVIKEQKQYGSIISLNLEAIWPRFIPEHSEGSGDYSTNVPASVKNDCSHKIAIILQHTHRNSSKINIRYETTNISVENFIGSQIKSETMKSLEPPQKDYCEIIHLDDSQHKIDRIKKDGEEYLIKLFAYYKLFNLYPLTKSIENDRNLIIADAIYRNKVPLAQLPKDFILTPIEINTIKEFESARSPKK